MKIHCALLCKNDNQILSASLGSNRWFYNSHEKNIRKYLHELKPLRDLIGVHSLKINGFYYACVFNDKIVVIATDQELPEQGTFRLYENVRNIENTAGLQNLIDHPEDAILSKIDKLQTQLDEAQHIISNSLGKVIERGERIEIIMTKTNTLKNNTLSFKKKTTDLNRTCPGFFSIFTSLSGYLWKTNNYEYHEQVDDNRSYCNK